MISARRIPMTRREKPAGSPALLVALALTATACGVEERLDAGIGLPPGASAVSITPAVDDAVVDRLRWSSRLAIEHVAVHLADVRLLGADPRIPSGGLDLLDSGQVIESRGRPEPSIRLRVPPQYLASEDLAVFLQLEPSPELEGASVEVFARLYADVPTMPEAAMLTAAAPDPGGGSGDGEDGVPDPDVDPARPSDDEAEVATPNPQVPDPDVDPAGPGLDHAGHEEVPDPDVDPARPDPDGPPSADEEEPTPNEGTRRQALTATGLEAASVPFVLRDEAAFDMVAILGPDSGLDVVIGIPADRWLTADVVARLEAALRRRAAGLRADPGAEVLEIRRRSEPAAMEAPSTEAEEDAPSEVYVADDDDLEGTRIRRR